MRRRQTTDPADIMDYVSQYLPFFTKFWSYFGAACAVYLLVKFFNNRSRQPGLQAAAGKKKDHLDAPWNDNDENFDCDPPAAAADYETDVPMIPYNLPRYGTEQLIEKSGDFYELMNKRRTTRFFSDEPIPRGVIENVIRTAGTSPSGAHTEPWTYVLISNKVVKAQVRDIIEAEEKLNYERRMGDRWVQDLKKFRVDFNKPYLEIAPYIVVIFRQAYGIGENGEKKTHYYNEISVSISLGILLAALQNVGLATVTSTPLNAGPAMRKLLNRPANEKLMMVLPVGFPAPDCTVPDLHRKPLEKIMVAMD